MHVKLSKLKVRCRLYICVQTQTQMHIHVHVYLYVSVHPKNMLSGPSFYTWEWDRLKSLDVVGRYTPTSQYMILVAGGEHCVCVCVCVHVYLYYNCVCMYTLHHKVEVST